MNYQEETIKVTCQLDNANRFFVSMEIENISKNTVCIFDHPRMPYQILSDGKLMILHAAHPPIDDYIIVESTPALPIRSVQPGEVVEHTIPIDPLSLVTQYEDYGYIYLFGRFSIQCWSGWLDKIPDDPLYTDDYDSTGYTPDVMLNWQQPLVPSEILEVDFGRSISDWIE